MKQSSFLAFIMFFSINDLHATYDVSYQPTPMDEFVGSRDLKTSFSTVWSGLRSVWQLKRGKCCMLCFCWFELVAIIMAAGGAGYATYLHHDYAQTMENICQDAQDGTFNFGSYCN